MEKRLFVITNATHYINVKNYIANKDKAKNYIFVTIRPYEGYQEFIDKIKNDPVVEFLGLLFTSQESSFLSYFTVFKNILKVKRLAKKYKFFDKVLFTNYKSWSQQFIINQFRTNQIVLISDGVGIILIADNRLKGNSIPFKSVPFNGNKFFLRHVLGISHIPNLHFYSPIKMEIPENDSIEIFKFKGSSSQEINPKKLYFVGSPIVEIGYLPMDKHLLYLSNIKNHFHDYEITYFAHRREFDENLEQYGFFGKVIKNETPFEEKMYNEKELPGVLMSFISSVLINLAPVFPEIQFFYYPIKSVDIPAGSIFLKNYAIILKSFRDLNEQNFQEFSMEESNY